MIWSIDPRFLTAPAWASQMTLGLSAYGAVPILRDEAGWRGWARQVVLLPEVAALGAPQPDQFADWRDWAVAFNLKAALLD